MNNQEQQTLSRLLDAIDSVPGVRNPKDVLGHVTYYMDMQEVRTRLRRVLRALLDKDPDYKEENQRVINKELEALDTFLALRKSQNWERPQIGNNPWRGHYYG